MSVFVAARTLCEESGGRLSNLEIQKVLYVAQMIHLGRTGHPLFSESFEAWDYGPVVPALYHRLKGHGGALVPAIVAPMVFAWGSPEAYSIADAFSMMQHMSAGELVTFAHKPGGAWERHYRSGVRNNVMPLDDIKDEWRSRMQTSDEAVRWAEDMAVDVEASPSRYLDDQNERAFRDRLFASNRA